MSHVCNALSLHIITQSSPLIGDRADRREKTKIRLGPIVSHQRSDWTRFDGIMFVGELK
jgi:hypothetical protein